MLSTCLSCIDASLLLSIGIEKSIVSTVSKVKYSVSYRTENTWYRPPQFSCASVWSHYISEDVINSWKAELNLARNCVYTWARGWHPAVYFWRSAPEPCKQASKMKVWVVLIVVITYLCVPASGQSEGAVDTLFSN